MRNLLTGLQYSLLCGQISSVLPSLNPTVLVDRLGNHISVSVFGFLPQVV